MICIEIMGKHKQKIKKISEDEVTNEFENFFGVNVAD